MIKFFDWKCGIGNWGISKEVECFHEQIIRWDYFLLF